MVDASVEYFFSELFTHLDLPIKLKINEDVVEFAAKYKGTDDEVLIS